MEKPLTPDDVKNWLFTSEQKQKVIAYVNNRLKFPRLNAENKIEVVIPLFNINDNVCSVHRDILLDFITTTYTSWSISFQANKSSICFTSIKPYEFQTKR